MRIIRGRYQRRRIEAPRTLPVRPTTDMAKESLFNILENYMDFEEVEALDLFAGTGNISYELVSRGCLRVLAVDENQGCVKFIRETAERLVMKELSVIRADVFRFVPKHTLKYGLVFCDPPYDCEQYDLLLKEIFETGLLKDDGLLVVEHSKRICFDEHPNFMEQRHYGKVNFSFFAAKFDE